MLLHLLVMLVRVLGLLSAFNNGVILQWLPTTATSGITITWPCSFTNTNYTISNAFFMRYQQARLDTQNKTVSSCNWFCDVTQIWLGGTIAIGY